MTLGEGAASFLLSKKKTNAISELVGIGYQVDTQSTMTGIPDNGENLYKSMKIKTTDHCPNKRPKDPLSYPS